jgi:C-terminal processing protease CtpA/Prc
VNPAYVSQVKLLRTVASNLLSTMLVALANVSGGTAAAARPRGLSWSPSSARGAVHADDGAEAFPPFVPRPTGLPSLDPYAIVVVSADEGSNLQLGDEILAIDGVPIVEALNQSWRIATGISSVARLRVAADEALYGEDGSEAALVVARARAEVAIKSRRVGRYSRPAVSLRVREGVPVIRVRAWSGGEAVGQIDQILLEHRKAEGVVFDVRDNAGGDDRIAEEVTGRFVDRPVVASVSFLRTKGTENFQRLVARVQPRGPWRFTGRVAVVMDEGCMSACVHFVSGMRAAGARLFGTPTDGACGWLQQVALAPGVALQVARTFPLQTTGAPALLGISPDQRIRRTLGDVAAGRDPALDAALAHVAARPPL